MPSPTDSRDLTRAERLILAGAAVRGVLAGATRAVVDWLLHHFGA